MNKLNLVKILKGKEGIKLYSPLCGECTFVKIEEDTSDYPIVVKYTPFDNVLRFTIFGQYLNEKNAECLLFPSKDNRDWSTFSKKMTKRVPYGEYYFTIIMIYGKAFVIKITDVRNDSDNNNFDNRNYFIIEKEAQFIADKINKLF